MNILQYLSIFSNFERVTFFKFLNFKKKLNLINTLQSILYDICFEISLFKTFTFETHFYEMYF